jgi:NADPH-dependent 2,4-dienoyl-CoA reductase/sulfur reductase-like enzyme
MPHAWKGDAQTTLLRKRFDAVPDGGVILILAPPNPSRCPPAPYERASIMAHVLKSTGRMKCKIVILDPKASFAMQGLFQEGWEAHYPGMIEWIDADIYDKIDSVDPATNSVTTGFETYTGAALVNVIPAQMAGAIARDAALADETGFCQVDHATMRSLVDANIYVIGDACASSEIPRSASAAHSQGKVAAMMVLNDLQRGQASPALYTNSCWSFIDSGDTIRVGGKFEVKDGKITATESYISNTGEAAEIRKRAEAENLAWY